jgi:hypothetical protein
MELCTHIIRTERSVFQIVRWSCFYALVVCLYLELIALISHSGRIAQARWNFCYQPPFDSCQWNHGFHNKNDLRRRRDHSPRRSLLYLSYHFHFIPTRGKNMSELPLFLLVQYEAISIVFSRVGPISFQLMWDNWSLSRLNEWSI